MSAKWLPGGDAPAPPAPADTAHIATEQHSLEMHSDTVLALDFDHDRLSLFTGEAPAAGQSNAAALQLRVPPGSQDSTVRQWHLPFYECVSVMTGCGRRCAASVHTVDRAPQAPAERALRVSRAAVQRRAPHQPVRRRHAAHLGSGTAKPHHAGAGCASAQRSVEGCG
jgi:hypothetical protein